MNPLEPMLTPGGSAQARLGSGLGYPQDFIDLVRASDLDETRAYLAWQLTALASGLTPDERGALLLLCGRLLAAEAQGSTRLGLDEQDRALVLRVPELAGGAMGSAPLVLDGAHLYTRRSHASEERVAATLARRLESPASFSTTDVEQALGEVARSSTPPPSVEQQAAVARALARGVGIISGGPGTGKTTTVLTLVRCLVRLGIPAGQIALCAPTGKAASRMEDDVRGRLAGLTDPADRALLAECPKAQTLHRLLGATGDLRALFRRAREPLPFRAVIVDESSMVDLVLMDRLLAALPEQALLVLLGDADQLPSVSAGSVFRDLGAFATRLEQGFRTDPSHAAGQTLSALARAVRAGDHTAVTGMCSLRDPGQLQREGVELVPGEARTELLRRYHQRHFASPEITSLIRHVYSWSDGGFAGDDVSRLDALASRLSRSRILTVTRERATGTSQTNAFLHELQGGGTGFLPGEPVLMLRNDYRRDLWNGDQGVAILLRRPGRSVAVAVVFRSRLGWVAVDAEPWGSTLDHAYALTAHKSQGSEFDEVLLLLPHTPSPLLTRELLYTAVSRARRSVVLCGALEMVSVAVGTRESRDSGVASRLLSLVCKKQDVRI
jgi:exodeoxyribonuclease V alpha subunit